MNIDAIRRDGGHGVAPGVLDRAEYFLYCMNWKAVPQPSGGLSLHGTNNNTNDLPFNIDVTFYPNGGMSLSFYAEPVGATHENDLPYEVEEENYKKLGQL